MTVHRTHLEEEVRVLAAEVIQALGAAGLTCATAESCTGGLVGHLLTEVPGSSASFMGSAVTYSNDAKQRILQVDPGLLETMGAVSAEVAAAMAHGARTLYQTDLAVSTTGVAGPAGGTAEKPVGLVYLHLAGEATVNQGVRRIWDADRTVNKLLSARVALRLLLDAVALRAEADA